MFWPLFFYYLQQDLINKYYGKKKYTHTRTNIYKIEVIISMYFYSVVLDHVLLLIFY